ncbi:MAG: heme ABC exporter ATP-binding protein CcmA [Reyranella sp.]|uniref:heme ABC exporter ATP-binding protein CcmA n=1 Tax=Reyranella sp. TaxID=1929291 RepID=UPI001AD20DB5|nr:heme ABC exporter ATP-binding protein CcmA [Reyranella sp.]MBN9087378.1 heme ABC exporter ATP-binding protein CcmA [Reyranella sp.]
MTDLEVTGLGCRRGGRPVFRDLSFSLAKGELLALTGRNGSGKTTLLRALALLVPADAGAIHWQGADVAADREAWRRRIAWLGHLDGLKGDLTVRENVATACHLREEGTERVDAALAAFELGPLASRSVRTLSAGQRRRAALARVVAAGARLWLLDEPLNALDAPSQAALRAALGQHLATGGLAIAATHAPIDVPNARTLLMDSSPPPGGEEHEP